MKVKHPTRLARKVDTFLAPAKRLSNEWEFGSFLRIPEFIFKLARFAMKIFINKGDPALKGLMRPQ